MTADDNNADKYVLGRGKAENERLKAQNSTLIRAVGYTLHPTIESRLSTRITPLHVTEIASGSGTFLASLAAELSPSSTIEGTDISLAASEAYRDELPGNVSLRVVNAKEDVEEGRKGRYDLVCIRFMNVANAPQDWEEVARHAAQLLKPGGALQWIEGDFLQCGPQPCYTNPASKTSACERFYSASLAQYPHFNYFVSNLAPLLKEAGFREVQQQISSSDRVPEMRREVSLMKLGALLSILRFRRQMRVEGALEEAEIEELRREVEAEFEEGVYMRCDLHTFVAFK